jgi:aconitate hydratase
VMAYRSNVPAIAEFTFQHRDREFPRRAREWGGGFIVAGHNYGQGSSREHAALAPAQLGVRAVVAKSFARIHRRNLIAQGILPLLFVDESDYERAAVGQTWRIAELHEIAAGADQLEAVVDGEDVVALTHDLLPREREIAVAGGLIRYLREEAPTAA